MMGLGTMLLDPLVPWWGMVLCLMAFMILAWRTYSRCNLSLGRRCFLFVLRVCAFLLLCWLLLQPLDRSRNVLREKPSLVVAVDDSASMEDRPPGVARSRGDMVRELLASRAFAEETEGYQVLPFRLGDGLTRGWATGGEAFGGGQSRLIAGLRDLRQATGRDRPFAVLLLTDGLDTSGLDLEGLVLDVPFVVPELENAGHIRRDSSLEYGVFLPDNQGIRRVVKGWKTGIRVTVNRLRGQGEDRIPVVLSRGGQELEIREVSFARDSRYGETVFDLEPRQLGNQAYTVAIRPQKDLEESNNRAEFALEVTDEENRVLYLEGMLRPDFKFFKRALQKERAFQTSVYLRMGGGIFMNFEDGEGGRDLKGLLTPQHLKGYKVLVLGEFTGDSFTEDQVKAVKDFVDRGGGLLLTGASRSYGKGGYLADGMFGPLSPVRSLEGAMMSEGESFPVTFSASGRNDGVFMKLASEASFAPLRSLWRPVKLSEGATAILETAEGAPVLAVRRYGEGRVCAYLSNTLYLLRLHGGGVDGVSDYDRLVSQTVFWMLPDVKKAREGESLQLLLKEDGADVNQKVCVGALSGRGDRADNLHCEVTWPDGRLISLPMQATMLGEQVGLSSSRNGFLSEFKATQVGTYRLEVVRNDGQRTGQKLLVVRRPMLEMTGRPINRALLQKLVDGSKGKFIPCGQFDHLLEGIRIPVHEKELVTEETLWDSWWWLVPLMALFCAEWYFRRRWDLV